MPSGTGPCRLSGSEHSVFSSVVPRPLRPRDTVTMESAVAPEAKEITLKLAAGTQELDASNIVFQLRVEFDKNRVVTSSTMNGKRIDSVHDNPYFTKGGDWYVGLIMEDQTIQVYVDNSYFTELKLKHRLNEIRFLTLSGDVKPMKKLSFEFADG